MAEHFLISRTDAIGDVILSLPIAFALKEKYPNAKITWIGKKYTEEIIKAASIVDAFFNYDDWLNLKNATRIEQLKKLNASAIIHVFPRKELATAAKKAGIKIRIGTSHRIFHWLTCNKLVNLGRKNSALHESQLNLRLLEPLGIKNKSLEQLIQQGVYLKAQVSLPSTIIKLFQANKIKIILHPRSQGSAREWGLNNYSELIKLLPSDTFQIFITGTAKEGEAIQDFLTTHQNQITNLTGKLTLAELITFIDHCDGLIAASTGPLHIAAALGKHALGIFPPIRPMHPGRWAPLGPHATYLCAIDSCEKCRKLPSGCSCMGLVTPNMVATQIKSWG